MKAREYGFHLMDLEDGSYLVRFYSKVDYYHVLENGPWIVLEHYLTVNRWRPNLRLVIEDIITTYVWAMLPGLPIEFFNEELLMAVGKHLDRADQVDQ